MFYWFSTNDNELSFSDRRENGVVVVVMASSLNLLLSVCLHQQSGKMWYNSRDINLRTNLSESVTSAIINQPLLYMKNHWIIHKWHFNEFLDKNQKNIQTSGPIITIVKLVHILPIGKMSKWSVCDVRQ